MTQCLQRLLLPSPSSPIHHQIHHLTNTLRSCAAVSDLHRIHAAMIKSGIDLLPFPASKLLAAAAILDPNHAFSLFRLVQSPTLFSFNSVLRAHSISPNPNLQHTLTIFNSIRARSIALDQFSFITTLKACSRKMAITVGEQIHCLAAKAGFDCYVNVRNTLLHLYCVCERVVDAHQVFDEMPIRRDSVSFSTMMGGYSRALQPGKVVAFLKNMFVQNMEANSAAIVTVFAAMADANWSGESLHGYCIRTGFCSDTTVGTAVVTMYCTKRMVDHARQVFDEIPERDDVLYNRIIDGYAKEGSLEDGLDMLKKMNWDGVKPNSATLLTLLQSCASSGALSVGRRIHEYAEEQELEIDASLGTALVDMYAKNGCLEEAVVVFDRMRDRDVKAWTAMIMGFGVHGKSLDALRLYDEMEESGATPNEVTLLAVLSACSHGGLVGPGKDYFKRIVAKYGLRPGIKHYGCVIDLLGRAGLLEEAYELVKSLPFGGDAMAWRALLAACRIYGEVEVGELSRRALADMCEEHPSDAILLSGGYAFAGRWGEAMNVVHLEATSKKEAGCSSIEMVAC